MKRGVVRGSLVAQSAPGGRPVFRLVLAPEDGPPLDLGFMGSEAAARRARDAWLSELALAGCGCGLATCCGAVAPRAVADDPCRVAALGLRGVRRPAAATSAATTPRPSPRPSTPSRATSAPPTARSAAPPPPPRAVAARAASAAAAAAAGPRAACCCRCARDGAWAAADHAAEALEALCALDSDVVASLSGAAARARAARDVLRFRRAAGNDAPGQRRGVRAARRRPALLELSADAAAAPPRALPVVEPQGARVPRRRRRARPALRASRARRTRPPLWRFGVVARLADDAALDGASSDDDAAAEPPAAPPRYPPCSDDDDGGAGSSSDEFDDAPRTTARAADLRPHLRGRRPTAWASSSRPAAAAARPWRPRCTARRRDGRRGVKNGDELIEVNGRRVEYVVASDAAHGTVFCRFEKRRRQHTQETVAPARAAAPGAARDERKGSDPPEAAGAARRAPRAAAAASRAARGAACSPPASSPPCSSCWSAARPTRPCAASRPTPSARSATTSPGGDRGAAAVAATVARDHAPRLADAAEAGNDEALEDAALPAVRAYAALLRRPGGDGGDDGDFVFEGGFFWGEAARRRAAAVRRVAVDAAPMGCTMVLHTCADEACCCRVGVEPGGRGRRGPAVAHARAMDVRTATAVAMTPALVQRLSSWAPDDELLETVDGLPAGLSRDEAAALLPLAEATVSDGVPSPTGPEILQDARGRRDAEDYPAYMLPPVSPEPRHSAGARESTDAVLPGSAVARLLELATLGPADDFDAAKKPRALKAPATRADAEARLAGHGRRGPRDAGAAPRALRTRLDDDETADVAVDGASLEGLFDAAATSGAAVGALAGLARRGVVDERSPALVAAVTAALASDDAGAVDAAAAFCAASPSRRRRRTWRGPRAVPDVDAVNADPALVEALADAAFELAVRGGVADGSEVAEGLAASAPARCASRAAARAYAELWHRDPLTNATLFVNYALCYAYGSDFGESRDFGESSVAALMLTALARTLAADDDALERARRAFENDRDDDRQLAGVAGVEDDAPVEDGDDADAPAGDDEAAAPRAAVPVDVPEGAAEEDFDDGEDEEEDDDEEPPPRAVEAEEDDDFDEQDADLQAALALSCQSLVADEQRRREAAEEEEAAARRLSEERAGPSDADLERALRFSTTDAPPRLDLLDARPPGARRRRHDERPTTTCGAACGGAAPPEPAPPPPAPRERDPPL
ncbi:hypothetical protein JL720_14694 [Aureococcus anophagefferens]|nr:hypothetical protein JL720_14694 [Aureococcus anophagefferens]